MFLPAFNETKNILDFKKGIHVMANKSLSLECGNENNKAEKA